MQDLVEVNRHTTTTGRCIALPKSAAECWFADNLRSASFQNGDPITYANNGGAWTSFGSPRRGVRDNNDALAAQQGYFYNFPAITDARGLCPAQYRVPTTTDFNNMVAQVIQLYGSDDNALFRAPGTLGNGGFWNGDALFRQQSERFHRTTLGLAFQQRQRRRPLHRNVILDIVNELKQSAHSLGVGLQRSGTLFSFGGIFCVWWFCALSQGQCIWLH